MKKILAMILALMMTVCVFAACSKNEEASKDAESNVGTAETVPASEEEAVEAAVNNFISLTFSGDSNALNYVKKDSDAYSETEELIEMFSQFEEFADEMGIPEEYAADAKEIIENFVNNMFALVECEVTSVTVDGDKAAADVKLVAPDFENFDMEELMGDADMEEILLENFSEAEIMALADASEDEQAKFMLKVIEILFDEVLVRLDTEMIEQNETFKLEKVGGEWLIVA